MARYMHESTKQPLCDVLNQVLVCNNLDRFQSELNALLRVQKHDGMPILLGAHEEPSFADLGLMYRLCARVENGHSMMRTTFEVHIKEQGLAAVNGLQQTRMASVSSLRGDLKERILSRKTCRNRLYALCSIHTACITRWSPHRLWATRTSLKHSTT